MTEIPGSFPKKVCPETFVSNHTGPIRLAEDQMQQLLECIHGVNLRSEPKPKPGQVKVSGEGWVGPYDKDDYIRTLETQIKCLQSNLDAANDRAHMAEGRAYSLMCDYNRCKKEAELEVERLKAQVPKKQAKVRIVKEDYDVLYSIYLIQVPRRGPYEYIKEWAEDHGLEVVE